MDSNLKQYASLFFATISVIVLLILLSHSIYALSWSEIMFNPVSSDDNKEYVELFGSESLVGCTIYDSASSDKLLLSHTGNDVIMIIENESVLYDNLVAQNNTIYMIGAAIGNGLGNTNDSLKIVCNVNGDGITTLLEMNYNIHNFNGFVEGNTIIYSGGEWKLGVKNGTPGVYLGDVERNNSNNTNNMNSTNTSQNNSNSSYLVGGRNSAGINCLESLHLIVSKTRANPGDAIEITLLSPSYASVEAKDASGNTILFKDTLEGSRFIMLAPRNGPVRIVAHGFICNKQERMTKIITIEQDKNVTRNNTLINSSQNISSSIGVKNNELKTDENKDDEKINDESQQIELLLQNRNAVFEEGVTNTTNIINESTTKITGNIIYDSNVGIIPWISAFGVAVVIVCGIMFMHLFKSKQL